MTYHPQTQHYAPAPPARKRRKKGWAGVGVIAALMLAVCGLAVVGAALLYDSDDNGTPVAQQQRAKLGEPVRDGKFEFTVTKVQCGVKSVGSKLTGETAQGQFCLVTMTVKNIGAEARTFTAGNQKAHGPAGVVYDSNTLASLDANGDSRAFLNDINPGNSVTGVVVFDIPADATLTAVEVHDSAFSGGTTITL